MNRLQRRLKTKYQKGRLCNAGYNIAIVNPDGDIKYCFTIDKYIGNVYEKIKFNKKILPCSVEFCGCPLNKFDIYLLEKAIKECEL